MLLYTYNVCTMHVHSNYVIAIHMYMYGIERSQRLTTYALVMLLLVMISLHNLTFRLMVTMVAEFYSLVVIYIAGRDNNQ